MANILIIAGFIVLIMGAVESAPSRVDEGGSPTLRTPPYRTCIADEDCETGEFCRIKSEFPVCTKCTDCVGVHKRVERLQCAKNWHQCGECLPGYKEVVHSLRELNCVDY